MVKEMNFQGTYSNEQMENKLEEFENFDYVPIGYKRSIAFENHQVTEDGQLFIVAFLQIKMKLHLRLNLQKAKQ